MLPDTGRTVTRDTPCPVLRRVSGSCGFRDGIVGLGRAGAETPAIPAIHFRTLGRSLSPMLPDPGRILTQDTPLARA